MQIYNNLFNIQICLFIKIYCRKFDKTKNMNNLHIILMIINLVAAFVFSVLGIRDRKTHPDRKWHPMAVSCVTIAIIFYIIIHEL